MSCPIARRGSAESRVCDIVVLGSFLTSENDLVPSQFQTSKVNDAVCSNYSYYSAFCVFISGQ